MQLRFRFLVIVALMMLVSSAAFGQINLTIQYNSSPKEIQTNRTAYSADPDSSAALTVIASVSSTSLAVTATTLIVDYPAIITTGRVAGSGVTAAGFNGIGSAGQGYAASAAEDTTPVNLRIAGASGVFAGASVPVITTVNYATGQVYIYLPFNGSPNAGQNGPPGGGQTGGAFRLENARVDANGGTAPFVATAALTSSANGYQIIAGNSGNVIDALAAGIASVSLTSTSQTSPDTAVVYTDRTRADNVFKVFITEGFASAWYNDGNGDFFDTTNTRDTELRLSFTGIPAGITVALTGSMTNATSSTGMTFTPASVNSSDNVSVVTWNAANILDRTASTVLTVTGTIGSISSSSGCCATGSVSMTASMSPVGSGNIAASATTPMTPDNTLTQPRFAAAEVGPVTVITITVAKTTMLIPLAMSIPSIKYDTGIAVSNTSKDPFGATGGATASSGTLTFYLFPRTTTGAGTSITWTTSATNLVGGGLDSSGVLAAGGTFTALLSEIWSKAGGTGDFIGYVFVEGNFLLGHGVSYISTFRGDFTAGAPVLEMVAPAVTARGNVNNLLTY